MLAAAVCTYLLVKSGDSCASLATRCGITAADFTKCNPSSTLCSAPTIGQPVCCSSGSLPSLNLTPQKNPDGTCASYTAKGGDYCALVAQNNYITVDNIEQYNTKTWGWNECPNLQPGDKICLSTGDPPMPAPVVGAVCGPQVAGAKRPSNWSDISSLNPCPLNACCDVWGQCGINPDFCTPSESSTGAPGTNGCISNCGTSIINNDEPPTEFRSIGYFESIGSQNVTAMKDSFTAALALSNYDVSKFENYNLTLLATALIGWDKCEKENGFDPDQIRSGWQQSWKIMNLINKEARVGIDWNQYSAFEYLGPPAWNIDYRDSITGILKNLATIQPGWFGDSNPFDWKIAVRCDDPSRLCSCRIGNTTMAYTMNVDAKYGTASINFCPNYFHQQTLDQVIELNANRALPWEQHLNMDNYNRNQGSIWIHELLHIDWVAKAGKYGTNQHISDLKLKFRSKDGFIYKDAHGPMMAKALGRFVPEDPITHVPGGTYTVKNADNLSLYALTRYVQKALGDVYPHLPLAPRPPVDASPSFGAENYFTFYNNRIAELPTNQISVCAAADDQDVGDRPDAFATWTIAIYKYLQQTKLSWKLPFSRRGPQT